MRNGVAYKSKKRVSSKFMQERTIFIFTLYLVLPVCVNPLEPGFH